MDLLNKLIRLEQASIAEVITTIKEHWANFWQLTERERWSICSRQACHKLKSILKYHLFEKRDGAIISQLLTDSGEITDDPQVIGSLLGQTIKEIQIDENWGWLESRPFPELSRLSQPELLELIRLLLTDKTLALDSISDTIFKMALKETANNQNEPTAISKLRNLWRTDWDSIEECAYSLEARLIGLNKVFPKTPTRTQMRPIIIFSAIIKLLEATFLLKLKRYLVEKVDRSQTGFVDKMAIQVNLYRALQRITARTSIGSTIFGLFIDFSNAYNYVPHTLLFKKLRQKKILEDDEVEYLECLYSRYKTNTGGDSFRTNRGVAQGSILSPALFDIFIEDLNDRLKLEADINLLDLLLYADDILVLCSSAAQLAKAINIIEDWCSANGMVLNKQKSAVIVFAPRRKKKIPFMSLIKDSLTGKTEWRAMRKDFNGIPILSSYKYLGTQLESRLSLTPQLAFIRRKSSDLFIKLYPYLRQTSADGRRDMWQTFIVPLFNATLILMAFEGSRLAMKMLEDCGK